MLYSAKRNWRALISILGSQWEQHTAQVGSAPLRAMRSTDCLLSVTRANTIMRVFPSLFRTPIREAARMRPQLEEQRELEFSAYWHGKAQSFLVRLRPPLLSLESDGRTRSNLTKKLHRYWITSLLQCQVEVPA